MITAVCGTSKCTVDMVEFSASDVPWMHKAISWQQYVEVQFSVLLLCCAMRRQRYWRKEPRHLLMR